MCGITGFNWKNERLLHLMNKAILHRGPHGEGTFVEDNISLGLRKCAIYNVSENIRQPMFTGYRDLTLVFNGIIYNFMELRDELISKGHRFRSRTDAEVILHCYQEYGADCVRHFNGMWAFCIYDKTKETLFLSRDRFGIKPLYYHYDNGRFIFASEIKALLEHDIPRKENRAIIFDYLYYNLTDHTEETFFEGIKRLMPGHNLMFDLTNNEMHISKYYDIPTKTTECKTDYGIIRELFTDSVKRSIVTDASVGSCLSGGIDSSSVVVTMKKVAPDMEIKTFSMNFPGENIDESIYQQEVNTKVNAVNYSVTPESSDLLEDVKDLFMTQEEPFSGTSVYGQYRVMKLARDNGIVVLLDGQGADQVLAGSAYFTGYYYYELMKEGNIIDLFRETIRSCQQSSCLSSLMYLFLRMVPANIKKTLYKRHKVPYLSRSFIKENEHRKDVRWHLSSLDEAVYGSVSTYALPHLLRFLDKNSMRFSIESRVPFLDHKLVEYLMSLPPNQMINGGVTKYAFRKAMEEELPEKILARRDKIGFAVPEKSWLKEEAVKGVINNIMNSESFKLRNFWEWDKVEREFERLQSGESQSIFVGTDIWRCISVELWMRIFIDGQDFATSREQCIPKKLVPVQMA